MSVPTAQMGATVAANTSDNEGDLGEIRGVDMDVNSEGDEDESITESKRKAKKRQIWAITCNTELLSIVSSSIIFDHDLITLIKSEVCCLYQHLFTEYE